MLPQRLGKRNATVHTCWDRQHPYQSQPRLASRDLPFLVLSKPERALRGDEMGNGVPRLVLVLDAQRIRTAEA
jgi:hypothetical protein